MLILLVSGCSNNSEKETSTVKILNENIIKHSIAPGSAVDINASIFISNLRTVTLEGTEYSMIGNIRSLAIDDLKGTIIINDSVSENALLVFTLDGEFVSRFNRAGRGPEEYTGIDDFVLYEPGVVEILDKATRRLIKYDILTGEWLSERQVPFHAARFRYLADGKSMVFYRDAMGAARDDSKWNYALIVASSDFEVIDKHFSLNDNSSVMFSSITAPQALSATSSGALFYTWSSDTLYTINEGGINPHSVIDFGEFSRSRSTETFSSPVEELRYFEANADKYVMGPISPIKTEKLLSFIFSKGDDLYYYIYRKDISDSELYGQISFDGSKLPLYPPFFHTNDTYVSVISWSQISQISPEYLNTLSGDYSELRYAIESSISEYENPVLLLYEFK